MYMNDLTSSTVRTKQDYSATPFLSRLLSLHKVPEKMHIQGTLPEITFDEYGRATPRILTVVGSRKHTTYGKRALESLLTGLAGYDVVVLSGLALGIDALAHQIALQNNLITIAVPGSGLAKHVLYPKNNSALADEIIKHNGALISELNDTSPATPWSFPQRNRIMAALSDALLVVEAEEKSGTLITARLALELGKDIGAIPGEIFSPTASGTNALIKEGAYPITSPSDLIDLLHLTEKNSNSPSIPTTTYSPHEKIIIELLREPRNKDTLFSMTKLSFQDFITAYSTLEMMGHIEESLGEVRTLV